MQITDQAKELIQSVMDEENIDTIRVVFSGMGWGGPRIGLALEEPTEEDVTQKINGISVSIEKQILPYVENVTLDMETGIDGKPGLVMIGGSGSNC